MQFPSRALSSGITGPSLIWWLLVSRCTERWGGVRLSSPSYSWCLAQCMAPSGYSVHIHRSDHGFYDGHQEAAKRELETHTDKTQQDWPLQLDSFCLGGVPPNSYHHSPDSRPLPQPPPPPPLTMVSINWATSTVFASYWSLLDTSISFLIWSSL